MIRIFTYILITSFFLSGCLSEEQKEIIKENRIELGDIKINYYSDKSVTSLEVPPDLTSPSYESSFRISEFANVDSNVVNLTNKEIQTEVKSEILKENADIRVFKSGNRRWLVINKSPELVWDLSIQFLKEQGFVIKKSNKKIGLLETDYLENIKPDIPGKTMGFFRAALQSAIENVNYTLPTVDKYTIMVEPHSDSDKTVLHLSISSMAEVITGSGQDETTLWQKQERNIPLENEMLYTLMIYLGSDSANAREKIINAKDEGNITVNITDGLNGYAKLQFNLNIIDTWDNLAWAFSNLEINIEDKDIKERAFYVLSSGTSDIGIMSKIFGEEAIYKTYQIQLKEIGKNLTEVYFNDISELNEQETKDYSYEFLGKVQKLF